MLDGEIPNKHKFTPQIQEAKKQRVLANQVFNGSYIKLLTKRS
jgi:hypothetical protein